MPFAALSAFVDPSVRFGLQFDRKDKAGARRQGRDAPPRRADAACRRRTSARRSAHRPAAEAKPEAARQPAEPRPSPRTPPPRSSSSTASERSRRRRARLRQERAARARRSHARVPVPGDVPAAVKDSDALPQAFLRPSSAPTKFNGQRRADGRARGADPADRPGLPATSPTCCGPGHLAQLRTILDDGEASANDKYVALELLKNANISAGGVLPMCQDTGTAIVMGKKGQAVWTGGGDEAAIAQRRLQDLHRDQPALLARSRRSRCSRKCSTGTNLPAQIDIYATDGDAYKFLFVAKGGGSANKSYLYQQTPAVLNEAALLKFLDTQIRTPRHRGLPALSPRHRDRRHLGRDEPQDGEARLDALSRRPAERGQRHGRRHPRPRDGEEGAGAHAPDGHRRAVRRQVFLPRRARDPHRRATAPRCRSASACRCSADRQALGKITSDGIFLEQLETNPAHYLPEVEPQQLSGDVVSVDLDKGMAHTLSMLTQASGEDAREPHRAR